MFTYILFISVIEQFLTSTAWPSNAIRNSSGNIQSHRLASIAIANQDTNRLKTASLLILLFYYLHNLQMGYFDKNLLRLGKSGPYSPSLDNGLINYAKTQKQWPIKSQFLPAKNMATGLLVFSRYVASLH
jgi:hypothetical protein